jgi:undecaprenyl-diphosphatase
MTALSRLPDETRPPNRASLGRNAAAIGSRLRRRRHATAIAAAKGWRRSRLLVSGLAAVLLIGLALALLDNGSVDWARGLPGWGKAFFREVTRFGKSDWFLIPTGVLGLALLWANWTRVNRAVAAAWAEIGALFLFFFVAVDGAGLLTDLIKLLLGRSRPVRFGTDGILSFQPISFESVYLSFPSGHATTVTAAAFAGILISRRFGWLLALPALVIAASRVGVRAHYPSDVLGGIVVGVGFTYCLALLLARAGFAFRFDAGGALRAQTIAIRSVLRRSQGWRALAAGLATALFGRRSPATPPQRVQNLPPDRQ